MKTKITAKDILDLMAESEREVYKLGNKTTVVSLVLPNGFVMVESSSCVDPENYDQEVGEKICLNRMEKRLWELEGYVLQTEIYLSKKTDQLIER